MIFLILGIGVPRFKAVSTNGNYLMLSFGRCQAAYLK